MAVFVYILLALLFSALFSGLEIAFVTSNKLQMELERQKGSWAFKVLGHLNKRPDRFIAAMLVGNNIALVIYGMFMPELLNPVFSFVQSPYLMLLIQTLASTVIILVLSEFIPKAAFSSNPTFWLRWLAVPAGFFAYLFAPVVYVFSVFTRAILRLFGLQPVAGQRVFDRVDLDHFVREKTEDFRSEDQIDTEVIIFKNALEFSQKRAREFMVPRTELIGLPHTVSLDALKAEFIASGLSKVLIFREDMDDIIGYIHAFELFKRPGNLRSVLRPVSFIPESMTASEIFKMLTRERRSLAVVIDEFGGTAGLITIEDVMEEIFGEIDDEHDVEDLTEVIIDDDEYRFSGRLEVDYLNEKYRIGLPDSDQYSTLSGLIVYNNENLPTVGEKIKLEHLLFTITKMTDTRIEEVRIKVLQS
jgi:CBS domain containing-hemolysin-like protein